MIRLAIAVLFGILALWIAYRVNTTRFDQGPVVLSLSRTHGLHLMDLVTLSVALPPWCYVAYALRRRLWSSRRNSSNGRPS